MKTLRWMMASSMVAGALLVSGCASTRIVSEWSNPALAKPLAAEKVFVVAVTKQESRRRQMEDAFSTALAARGAACITAYSALPDAGPVQEESLRAAVKASGADSVLLVRLMKVDTRYNVSPGYVRGPSGLYGGYSSSWISYYEPPTVYEYDVVTLEARLYNVETEKIVWAAATETTDPRDIEKEIQSYAAIVCDRLGEAGYLGATSR